MQEEERPAEADMQARLARAGDTAALQALLDSGRLEVDVADEDGWTALFHAAAAGQVEAAALLVERGAGVERTDTWLSSPLLEAVKVGGEGVVALLLGAGATTATRDTHQWSPLLAAAYLGHTRILARLLAAGADPAERGPHGESLVMNRYPHFVRLPRGGNPV